MVQQNVFYMGLDKLPAQSRQIGHGEAIEKGSSHLSRGHAVHDRATMAHLLEHIGIFLCVTNRQVKHAKPGLGVRLQYRKSRWARDGSRAQMRRIEIHNHERRHACKAGLRRKSTMPQSSSRS